MLPTTTDNGARLAGILPGALASVIDHASTGVRAAIVVVVDGLGWVNLRERRGHARTVSAMAGGPISTVAPSTTGAALSTLTTGSLPGQHGLIGYRIRHPKFGVVTTLNEWEGITAVREWQLRPTVFERAREAGIATYAVGRGEHREGGLTSAILTGARYVDGDTIAARVDAAVNIVNGGELGLVYLYVDELDRAGHRDGWQSDAWIGRLEQLDAAVADLLRRIPKHVGVILTADHGMIDIPFEQHVLFDDSPHLLDGVTAFGGEPRLRYLYVQNPSLADEVADRVRDAEGERAWVLTRAQAIDAGLFGQVEPQVTDRIGDVIVAAQTDVAYYLGEADADSRRMVGQHGSFTDIERMVPLLAAGALEGAV